MILVGRRHPRLRLALLTLLAALLVSACSTLGALSGLLGNQISFTAPQLQALTSRAASRVTSAKRRRVWLRPNRIMAG